MVSGHGGGHGQPMTVNAGMSSWPTRQCGRANGAGKRPARRSEEHVERPTETTSLVQDLQANQALPHSGANSHRSRAVLDCVLDQISERLGQAAPDA